VRWYWLLDTEARSLEILRLGDDGRYVHAVDTASGRIDVPGCEDLTLDLNAVRRELDEEIDSGAPSSEP
jgi:hypothetical protein